MREDTLFGHLSLFTSVIANMAGQPKKPIKPDALYEPNLTRKKRQRQRTPEEERVWKERLERQYEDVMNPKESPGA